MPQLNIPIPSFLSGVSQQPRSVRPIEAAEDVVNGVIQIAKGLEKRPPSEAVATLTGATGETQLLHTIDRDEEEQYVAWFGDNGIRVYDTQGTEFPVYGDGSLTGNNPDFSYLKTPAPNPLQSESIGVPYDIEHIIVDGGPWGFALYGIPTVVNEDRFLDLTPMIGPQGESVVGKWVGTQPGPVAFDFGAEIEVTEVPVEVGKTYTFSVYARGIDSGVTNNFSKVSLLFRTANSPSTETVGAEFSLAYNPGGPSWTYTESVVGGDPRVSARVEALSNGWSRLVVQYDAQLTTGISSDNLWVQVVATTDTGTGQIHQGYFYGPRVVVSDTLDLTPAEDAYYETADLEAVSIADFTFVTNRATTVRMSNELSPALSGDALLFVKQAGPNLRFTNTVSIGGTEHVRTLEYGTSSPQSPGTVTIASDLAGDTSVADTVTGYTPALPGTTAVSRDESVVLFSDSADTIDWIKVTDAAGDSFTAAFTDSVDNINDLPRLAPPSFKVRVSGDPELGADDYWLEFEAEDDTQPFSPGDWAESVAPGIKTKLDASTMPHQLVRKEDDASGSVTGTPRAIYFQWGPADWAARAVGDEETNPDPSFVGRQVTDLFFYNDRLGMLSGDNVVMSQAGEFFNFWRTTVQVVPDDEAIDIAVTGTDVADLQVAVQYDQRLILFDRDRQYQLIHEGPLTPGSVRVDSILEYDCLTGARPQPSGNTLFMATPKGAFSGVREVIPLGDEDFIAQDVTEPLPEFVSGTTVRMETSPTEELLFVLTDARDKLYVHSYYWEGREKRLAAWMVWEFGSNLAIQDIACLQDELFLLMRSGDGFVNDYQLHLEKVQLGDVAPDFNFRCHLDSRFDRTIDGAGDFSFNGTQTVWTPPGPVYTGNTYTLVQSAPGLSQTIEGGGYSAFPRVVARFAWSGSQWLSTTNGDYTANDYIAGIEYGFSFTFTPPYISSRAGAGRARRTEGDLRLRRLFVNHFRCLELTISHTETPAATPVSVQYVATSEELQNDIVAGVGEYDTQLRVAGTPDRTVTTITSGGYGPCSLQSAEWICDFTSRSRRAG